MSERLRDRFARLCEIRSPTGSEREIADTVAAELRALGAEVAEDDSAGPARAGAGNLLARIPGRGEGWMMFCAHLDTVPHDGPIDVVLEEGVYRSAGETILGADNKAAVAVLLELAERHSQDPPPVGIELLLTVAEEDGLRGAHAFDVSALRAGAGVVLDHATPIGEVITAAPSYQRVVAEFEGAEAHAGIRPEQGHSAIAAAAAAIAAMQLGRLDAETTANVGVIEGGTASNVVPGHCVIFAEARGIDGERAAVTIGEMVDACTWAAGEHGCDVDARVTEMFRGYRVPPSATSVRLAREALTRTGFEPRETATGGGSDANALIDQGFEALLLANGTEANHTPAESVAAARITEMLAVCEAIARLAGEGVAA